MSLRALATRSTRVDGFVARCSASDQGGLLSSAAVALRVSAVVVDCLDPERVGQFWSAALSRPVVRGEEGVWWWLDLGQGNPGILFLQNPEPKVVKNRLHLDLRPDDQRREVERLIGLGAREKDIGQGAVSWVVMADPADNEFCVLEPELWPPDEPPESEASQPQAS